MATTDSEEIDEIAHGRGAFACRGAVRPSNGTRSELHPSLRLGPAPCLPGCFTSSTFEPPASGHFLSRAIQAGAGACRGWVAPTTSAGESLKSAQPANGSERRHQDAAGAACGQSAGLPLASARPPAGPPTRGCGATTTRIAPLEAAMRDSHARRRRRPSHESAAESGKLSRHRSR